MGDKSVFFSYVVFLILLFCQEVRVEVLKSQRDKANIQVEMLSRDINKQNAAIANMKTESDKLTTKILAAEKESYIDNKKIQRKSSSILASKVSKDCDAAILWGARQGAKIYDCWAVDCNK